MQLCKLVSCQAMMCGRIVVRQSIRELYLWLKMRMIDVVMIGWTRCLMLYGQSLKQTVRILLHRRCKSFFDMLKALEESLHEHTIINVLAFVTRITSIKSKFAFSNKCYKELLRLFSDVLPSNHKMPKDMYQSKNYYLLSVWSTRRLMCAKITA
jgi:hypothetical protein